MKNIIVLRIRPGEPPERIQTENSFEGLCAAIGAERLECTMPFDDSVTVISSERKMCSSLPMNRALVHDSMVYDVIKGTFLIAGDDTGAGFTSLSFDMSEKYRKRFLAPEIFTIENGRFFMCRTHGDTTENIPFADPEWFRSTYLGKEPECQNYS